MIRKPSATKHAVLRAFNRAAKFVTHERPLATSLSVGFLTPRKGEVYQVFIRISKCGHAHRDVL